jgi:hypothetical protein
MANWFFLSSGTDKTETLINLDVVPHAVKLPNGSVVIQVRADHVINITGDRAARVWEMIKRATVKNQSPEEI